MQRQQCSKQEDFIHQPRDEQKMETNECSRTIKIQSLFPESEGRKDVSFPGLCKKPLDSMAGVWINHEPERKNTQFNSFISIWGSHPVHVRRAASNSWE